MYVHNRGCPFLRVPKNDFPAEFVPSIADAHAMMPSHTPKRGSSTTLGRYAPTPLPRLHQHPPHNHRKERGGGKPPSPACIQRRSEQANSKQANRPTGQQQTTCDPIPLGSNRCGCRFVNKDPFPCFRPSFSPYPTHPLLPSSPPSLL